MAKQIKSVRFDEEVINVFLEYSVLLNEMFGYTLSFGAVANEAVAEFLMNASSNWCSAMESKSVIDRLPNGKIKKYEFSEEQIEKMENIHKKAMIVWTTMQEP